MIKKGIVYTILFSIIIASVNISGCSKFEGVNPPVIEIGEKNFGLLIDDGKEGDKAYNDLAVEGIKRAEIELGGKAEIIQAGAPSDYKSALEKLVKDSGLILGSGFRMKEAINEVAKNNSNKSFILIDDTSNLPNVKSIIFNEEQGAFLMGVIAGKMTTNNKVGFIGGVEMPNIEKFESGFAAGVKSVNSLAAQGLINKKLIRYSQSFSDVNKGYELAKSLYDEGVDIVFHAAGGLGEGIFRAAKEKNRLAIGVDKDQALEFPEYSTVIISSMIKKVDKGIFDVCNQYINGALEVGKDNLTELGLKEAGIDIAPSTKEHVPKEVLELVNKYKEKIVNGDIQVPKNNEELIGYEVPNI